MRNNQYNNNEKQKSLIRRFLFFIGIIFLLLYVVLGVGFIVWKEMPVTIPYKNRVIFGVILLVYAAIRFFRIIKNNREE
ncbi:MAG TPA: hypothetical protein VKY32_03570 [Flavobacterium sp.]|nr:hypothetical protein [Flavobacterium sp.]